MISENKIKSRGGGGGGYEGRAVIRSNTVYPLECSLGIICHVALHVHRNPGVGFNTLLMQLSPGDLYIACPQRQFHTLHSLSHSQAALPNSYPNLE